MILIHSHQMTIVVLAVFFLFFSFFFGGGGVSAPDYIVRYSML